MVSGTATGIGKTWVTAALARRLRAGGLPLAVRKPVQSFEEGDGPTDAEVLAAAGGEAAELVCPPRRWLARALAPPMAAEALGLAPFTLAELLAEARLPDDGLALVEGVGGPRSPLAADGDTVALAEALGADEVVLVAGAELGAINAVRLAAAAFAPRRPLVLLNRFDPAEELHAANLAWLRGVDGFEVLTDIPELATRLAALTVP
ncbi:MAG TPA: dethiobiotin synthase [Actinomycetota bacterium]